MQVPLTGHLREPVRVGERPFGVVTGPLFVRSSPPLSVVERLAVAVAGGVAFGALFWAVIADDGHLEPETSVSDCEQMWSDSRSSAEFADVDRHEFIAPSVR